MSKGDKRFYVEFTREEITHVSMSMELLEQDYAKLRNMETDAEIEAFIQEKYEQVCYTPGKVDTFYEWHSGKECVEGEGEKGIFDFSITEWIETSPAGSTKSKATEIGE